MSLINEIEIANNAKDEIDLVTFEIELEKQHIIITKSIGIHKGDNSAKK